MQKLKGFEVLVGGVLVLVLGWFMWKVGAGVGAVAVEKFGSRGKWLQKLVVYSYDV